MDYRKYTNQRPQQMLSPITSNWNHNDHIKLEPPADLKMRPIVAGPISPTHRLSNFVDLILKPLCQHVPSFIRDSMDFLNKIPGLEITFATFPIMVIGNQDFLPIK